MSNDATRGGGNKSYAFCLYGRFGSDLPDIMCQFINSRSSSFDHLKINKRYMLATFLHVQLDIYMIQYRLFVISKLIIIQEYSDTQQ